MFGITIKRSAATLGVVVGVLAAAGPANAQFLPTGTGVTAPKANIKAVVVLIGANDYGFAAEADGTQVGSEGVKANNLRGEAIDIIP